jgi:GTP-binding protein EngB required for normal cell division
VTDTLADLLRRAHRDELLPLARVLGVNPTGLGFDVLCRNLDVRLRQVGGHELLNIVLRKGAGPTYADVLTALADRLDVELPPAPRELEDVELRILDRWLADSWDELTPEQRRQVWERLGLTDPLPGSGSDATQAAHDRLGSRFGYEVATLTTGGPARIAGLALAPLLGPFAGVALAMWLFRPKDDVLLPAVLEVCRLRQTVRHRVTIGIVGSPSSGKDACIRAVFGIDTGNIDPVAGSTREVTITRLPGPTALFLVNTPGMGDVLEAVTAEARQILDHVDLFVYVLNAQGGVQAREKGDVDAIVARGRPVLVAVNKIDTIRDEDRARYLQDAQRRLNVPAEDFIAVAFDPLPQLAEAPLGVAAVRDWLATHLEALGKDPAEVPWPSGSTD